MFSVAILEAFATFSSKQKCTFPGNTHRYEEHVERMSHSETKLNPIFL